MGPIVVVGSGPSGAHFALSSLERGLPVTMLDVGKRRPPAEFPEEDFAGLRARHPDPVRYFLGEGFESLVLPGRAGEYYGFPPNKGYVFEEAEGFDHRAEGFSPLLSFAAGGLAESWTGGCYPFNDRELREFPIGYADLAPFYEEVARRIGISGEADDLTRFLPHHGGIQPPLDLDEGSAALLEAYRAKRARLNARYGFYAGRARVATLSRDLGDRPACRYLGRCLWGCPGDSLYTPSVTLERCRAFGGFRYVDGLLVDHFRFDSGGRIREVVARSVRDGTTRRFGVGTLVLAAGTLGSSKIVLDSIYRDTGRIAELRGLMDNRQVLMPFVNLRLVGRPPRLRSYQYHQVAFGIDAGERGDYVHGLVTTLKTATLHPIIQRIPGPLRAAAGLFRDLHGAFGLANVNFADRRRNENSLTLEPGGRSGGTRLIIRYRPEPGEAARVAAGLRVVRGALRALGCIAPASMAHVRPMGASVHYAGTIPMAAAAGPSPTADEHCRSRDFENLYFADGTTFPALPAKNLTFTLMANAARVAESVASAG